MAVDRAKLLASKDQAVEAKRAFESAFSADLHHCAVGLAPSRDGQHWALKVYVQTTGEELHLPPRFDDLDVYVESTGNVSAY